MLVDNTMLLHNADNQLFSQAASPPLMHLSIE